jgi:hypothetical protein
MMPGLHPGLLLASRPKIRLRGMPDYLYIGTAGGAGTRSISLFLDIENALGPFDFSWVVSTAGFDFDPTSGSGTSNVPYVGFTTETFHDGGLWQFTEVGSASLTVTAANGAFTTASVPIFAGQ